MKMEMIKDVETLDYNIKAIIEHYGTYRQKLKAIEELTELSEVIIKEINKMTYDRDSIIEEMADVQIMLWQLQEIYRVSDIELDMAINSKIRRTMKHVRSEINFDRFINEYNHGNHTNGK